MKGDHWHIWRSSEEISAAFVVNPARVGKMPPKERGGYLQSLHGALLAFSEHMVKAKAPHDHVLAFHCFRHQVYDHATSQHPCFTGEK